MTESDDEKTPPTRADAAATLLGLARTADDARYGFPAVMGNIPRLAASIGRSFGLDGDAAMALGFAVAIVASRPPRPGA